MVDNDDRWMAEAMKEARLAEAEGEVPIGAVVVCRGMVVGRGHNETERLRDVTAHAEVIAITAAAQSLGANTLTTALSTSPSSRASCAPAPSPGRR